MECAEACTERLRGGPADDRVVRSITVDAALEMAARVYSQQPWEYSAVLWYPKPGDLGYRASVGGDSISETLRDGAGNDGVVQFFLDFADNVMPDGMFDTGLFMVPDGGDGYYADTEIAP